MNTIQSSMLPANYDGHTTTTVTYQPTYNTRNSCLSRRTIIVLIVIFSLVIIVGVVGKFAPGLFNLIGIVSTSMNEILYPLYFPL
jgi:hypothetical protein